MVLGDLNANMLRLNEPDTRYARRIMSELSLKLVKTGPSHHISSNSTWIDNILVDNSDTVVEHARGLAPFPSGHDIISAAIGVFQSSLPNSSYTYRSCGKITPQDLSSLLTVEDWSFFSLPEEEFENQQGIAILTDKIQGAIDQLAPEKTIDPRKSLPPWITTKIRLLRSKRDATGRRYGRTGSRQLVDEFLELVTTIEDRTEAARCAYMHDRFDEAIGSN